MARHHIYLISVCLALLATKPLICAAQFAGGAGTADDPYQIATAEQLDAIGADSTCWDKHFKLVDDIDLRDYKGTDFHTIGYWQSDKDNKPFTGVFDGGGHSLSNFQPMYLDRSGVGLFGYVSGRQRHDPECGACQCPRVRAKGRQYCLPCGLPPRRVADRLCHERLRGRRPGRDKRWVARRAASGGKPHRLQHGG